MCSEFIDEVLEGGDADLESLSLSDLLDDLSGLGCGVEGIGEDHFPMVEDALGESSS